MTPFTQQAKNKTAMYQTEETGIDITYPAILGIPLERWTYRGCYADFAVDREENWCTLYFILSNNQGKGEATHVLKAAKRYYQEALGMKFGSSVALNDRMHQLLKKLEIKEYFSQCNDCLDDEHCHGKVSGCECRCKE